ncbi:hypothetical protein AVEN_98432-1 [Araneus ventricosus]|uniref:Uncharacterized protein n=1 Tax=Araneus ventricosus TaxID=182803 RepID=A0A4Y2N9E6_ARAVE|nr:hypothetical protein AVEN_98432-1 [Araneus ventricosus]
MLWDLKIDCLTYEVNIKGKDCFSKREVLSEIARLYDPLGLIGPFATKAKIFIQGLWKLKLDWWEQLPSPDSLKEWKKSYLKLAEINNFKIRRYILLPEKVVLRCLVSATHQNVRTAVVCMKSFTEYGQVYCAVSLEWFR